MSTILWNFEPMILYLPLSPFTSFIMIKTSARFCRKFPINFLKHSVWFYTSKISLKAPIKIGPRDITVIKSCWSHNFLKRTITNFSCNIQTLPQIRTVDLPQTIVWVISLHLTLILIKFSCKNLTSHPKFHKYIK